MQEQEFYEANGFLAVAPLHLQRLLAWVRQSHLIGVQYPEVQFAVLVPVHGQSD